MAVGDVVADTASVATTAHMTIQPGAGVEWVIHNLGAAAECEVSWYDGTDELIFSAGGATGLALLNMQLHVTNTQYLRIKNTNAGSKICHYDGVITK